MITHYPSIYTLGHKAILDIFKDPVIIEEKVDGSQFSFRVTEEGEIQAKSKGQQLYEGAIQNLFKPAYDTMTMLAKAGRLNPGWTYRAESICKPRHNTLCYNRIPTGGLIIFDIDMGLQNFLPRRQKEEHVELLGLEIVPLLYEGKVEDMGQLQTFLDKESVLGGCKVEGFVVKNYNRFTIAKSIMIGKFVSEAFKEKHGTAWKHDNPGKKDIIEQLEDIYRHENRWIKAIQHLSEAGVLTDTPSDIGPLLKEIQEDVYKECADELKEALFKWGWNQLSPRLIKGFPMWYKERIAKVCFDKV